MGKHDRARRTEQLRQPVNLSIEYYENRNPEKHRQMSEKRQPGIKLSAVFSGKRVRVELFPSELWPEKFQRNSRSRGASKRYRVRVNGKWADGENSYTLTQVLNQLRMLITRKT